MTGYVLDGSGGSFNLNGRRNPDERHQNGIYATTANGNIQVSGARTFNAGADYIFNYTGAGTQNTEPFHCRQ